MMDDQFLYRLRRDPPPGFAARLKRQLDRPAPLRPTRLQLLFALAIFGTAFALTSPTARHTVLRWVATQGPRGGSGAPLASGNSGSGAVVSRSGPVAASPRVLP